MSRKKPKRSLMVRFVDRFVMPVPDPADLVIAGLAAAGALIAVSEFEKNHPVYAEYRIDSGGKLSRPLRAVFLTDLHEKEFGPANADLIEMIERADPDLILIGGDMIIADRHTGRRSSEAALRLCRALAARWPVYYGNGNHESRMAEEFALQLAETGVIYLNDRSADFGELTVTGVNLDRKHYTHGHFTAPDEAYMREHIGELDRSRFNILLAHSPNFLEAYARTGADLVLAGHFHGGTIRLPGDVGLMTPQYQFLNENVTGLKEQGGTRMIVSSGLGTHTVNVRLNNRPQVVVIDLA